MKVPDLKTSRYLAIGEVAHGVLTNEQDGYHFEESEDWRFAKKPGRCQLKSFGRVRLARLPDGRLRLTATWDAKELTKQNFAKALAESESLSQAFAYITQYAERRDEKTKQRTPKKTKK